MLSENLITELRDLCAVSDILPTQRLKISKKIGNITGAVDQESIEKALRVLNEALQEEAIIISSISAPGQATETYEEEIIGAAKVVKEAARQLIKMFN